MTKYINLKMALESDKKLNQTQKKADKSFYEKMIQADKKMFKGCMI